MPALKRKTTLTLDARTLDEAQALDLNVSAIAEAALVKAIAQQRENRWTEEDLAIFKAQDEWLRKNGHPLADIMVSPLGDTWKP